MLNHLSIPRILLLTNDVASTHSVRQAIRRAGLTVTLDPISSREEFLSRCRPGAVDLILAAATGFDGMAISEILERARTADHLLPVVLLGRDAAEGQLLMNQREGETDFVRTSQFDRLPSILDRILRRQYEQRAQAEIRGESDRAAEILRENQKLITLGRLAASISHEINNPLESITNLLYLMEHERDSAEKRREYLRLAQRELNRVVQISKQTLTFSRETSSPTRIYLAELIEEVLVLYGRKLENKNLHVRRQYESNESVIVFPGEMRQVLSNLIANAIEATQPGGALTFRIRSTRNWSDHGVHGVRLSVADNGQGMSAEVRTRLGEPFFTTKGQHGTGLGLWVTRSILNRYGGNLQLRSSVAPERHGTVFSMFLPTNMRPQAVAPREPGASTPGSPFLVQRRNASRSNVYQPDHYQDEKEVNERQASRRASRG
jgi:signal transduction histidine kinase